MASSFQVKNQRPTNFQPTQGTWDNLAAHGIDLSGAFGGGGGGSYGGSQSPLLALAQSWQDAQDKANKANNDRYENIVSGYQDNYNQALQHLDKSGAMQKVDVGEAFDKRAADVKASAVNRGLSNTTVRDTMLTGNEKERLKAMNRVEEQLNNQRLGYQTSLKNALLQFMERRNDTAPDFGQLLQMAQLMGAGGVGGNQALQYGGGGGGFASTGGGSGMGQPYVGNAQFAGMGGFGGPNGFGNWGGNQGGWGGGGQGNQGLNLAQQQWANQNALANAMSQLGIGGGSGGGGTVGGSSWYPSSPHSGIMPPVQQSGNSYDPADFGGQPSYLDWNQPDYDVPVQDWYYNTPTDPYGYSDYGGGGGYYSTLDEYYY